MADHKLPLIDRLRDRGFIDQWGFMAFAVLGFVGIVSGKWLNVEAIWIAIGANALMLVYAIVIGRAGTGRLRADQAGDNCYYLGLIYTLASLSYAIATFDPNDTASTIVQGFGVALATTIFGLILRVFFNQGRPDLENIEEQTRLELTEVATRLKSEMSGVIVQMNDFTRQMQQSMQEMHESATARMSTFTVSSVDGLRSVVETANEAIRSEANDFASRSKRYSTTFDKLLAKLEQHSDGLEHVAAVHEALTTAANLTKETAENTAASVNALSEGAAAARTTLSSAETASTSMQRVAEIFASSISSFQTNLEAIQQQTDEQLQRLKDGPSEIAENALVALNNAASALESRISKLIELQENVFSQLAQQAKMSLEAAQKNNVDLEAELERSRGLVSQVHASLADMTGQLANRFEGAPQ